MHYFPGEWVIYNILEQYKINIAIYAWNMELYPIYGHYPISSKCSSIHGCIQTIAFYNIPPMIENGPGQYQPWLSSIGYN